MSLDEEVVQRVNDLRTTPWSGQTFRHTSRGRDPLSGVGARRFGGRWNPADICATVYLAQPKLTCLDEFARLAQANNQPPEDMLRLPRDLHTIDVTALPVLDLRDEESLDYGGIVAPSATGAGLVIAVFEARMKPGELTVRSTEALDADTYRSTHP